MSNIFNDRTDTELNQRTINFQNLSVGDTTIPVLGLNNNVSGQIAGLAGLDLISKETLDDIKEEVLGTRLKNLSSATFGSESVATINGDTINSTPVSESGKTLMNITSIADLRSQILETSEEAVVFTADGNNEINFYTGTTQTASDLRLQLKNDLITLQTGDESMNMKVDNQNTWFSFSEQIVFDNLEGDKINFYKNGTVLEDNLYKLEVDATTGNTKTLVYVSPEEHLFKVKDTGNSLQDILLLEKTHVHITSDSGIMINGGFNIKNGNHGELATTNGNKNLYYKTHGTGQHIFYVNDTTEIFKIESTSINCNKILKTITAEGDKIHWDTTSKVYTSAGELHFYTTNRDTMFWADGIHVIRIRGTDVVMNKPLSITGTLSVSGNITANLVGDVNGNATTATKIASITNSNIVQLDDTQTLKNKTLTSPIITGATIAGNILPNANGTLNIGSSILRFNTGYIDNIEINVCNIGAGIIFQDIDNTKITFKANHSIGVLSAKTNYVAPTHQFLSGITPIFDIALDGMDVYKNILPNVDSTIDLGTSSKKYNYIYTDNIETETINSSNSITLKNGVNNLLSLSSTETTTYKNILPNAEGTLSLGSSSKRWDYVYALDISVLDTINSTNVNATIVDAPSVITSTIDFADTLADKILLYGTSYKLSVSDSSIDYITGDKHTFKASTNNLLILNNTSITTYKPIIPDTTGAIDIGSSTKLFNNGYINTLKTSSISPETTNGNLTLSGNGNGFVNITSTLTASVGVILGKAIIGAVFAYGKFGVKSDGGALFIGNAAWDDNYSIFGHGVDSKNASNQYGLAVGIGTNSSANYGIIKCIEPGFTWRRLHLSANDIYFDQTGTERMRIAGNIVCSTNIIPDSTINNRTIGSAGNLWNEIFCGNATINTSDRTKKKDIDYENIDKYADQLLNLKPCTYKFIKNSSNRNHMGLISQDLEGTIFEKTGTFIKSPKTKTITETIMVDGMKSSRDKEVEIPNEYDYGLRYGELIAPMIRLLQKQQKQINELLTRVSDLESGSGNELSFI